MQLNDCTGRAISPYIDAVNSINGGRLCGATERPGGCAVKAIPKVLLSAELHASDV